MSQLKNKVSNEKIESFLQGSNAQKYIVAVEAEYNSPKVTLVINDPISGKRLETDTFNPFLWFKEDITTILYGGGRLKIIKAAAEYGVKITKLRTSGDNGISPKRMENGYKYMATCNRSYNDLINFFKNGGIDIFNKEFSKNFVMFSPIEQYLIQSGKRLFKGMDDYDDVHRFQFDLETEGLYASKHAIFQIGVRDNRGKEYVLETLGETPQERRDSERDNIEKFFKIIDIIQPDVITGYNSENFDWPFLFERAERLGVPITEAAITLNKSSKIKRKPATLKLGGETEAYQQTHLYGYNVIDISHAVRRAMAINSEIKSWGLKYITKYSDIAKPNRVYVVGDKINSTWKDNSDFAFNDKNGDWYKISEKSPLKPEYTIVKGNYIVQRYLCDDLWETEQIDNLFNQASFLISKMLPTTFMRASTMGTAGQWKLLMSAWSYENGLAIPETQQKRDFTGGLSRLFEVGYARNVVKMDYAALYPKTQLTHLIFPELDITGVMEGMLTYVVDTRDNFKFLTGKEKKLAKKLQEKLDANKTNLTADEIEKAKNEINEHKALSNLYDKKQLPLKILANSWFGSYGAAYIFNWGDIDSAEETTCRGRQYLRLMVKFFKTKYSFNPLVLDTDGCNFSFPENIKDVKYIAKGTHWKTIEDADKELTGLDAVLAEFNETYMTGRMGLDIDDICNSTINFSRKNYANDIGGKIKLVGNSIKSKKMSVYIEEFLGKAIRMLLDGDGYSFINYYYEYVDKIYNFQIPLVKIATKAKVKLGVPEYKKKMLLKNKRGNPLPRQAHMELAIKHNFDVSLGDVLYYINTGIAKSHGDLKTVTKGKLSKKETENYLQNNTTLPPITTSVELNCKPISPEVVERDFELIKELEMLKKTIISLDETDSSRIEMETRIEIINNELFTDEYNVARYLDAFNKKVKPLLVCFNPEIRDNILLDIVKVKDVNTKKKIEKLKDRVIFTKNECELVHGMPFNSTDQDSYEELMTMEDKEIKFWDKVNKLPNNMETDQWNKIRIDYHERMIIAKEEGIRNEKETIDDIIRHLEMTDINKITKNKELPEVILTLVDLDFNTGNFISRKWNEVICHLDDLFKYESEAIERNNYYKLIGAENADNRYEEWLNYCSERKHLTGNTSTETSKSTHTHIVEEIIEKIKETPNTQSAIEEDVKIKKNHEDDDEYNEESIEDNNDKLIRSEETLKLDDEFDDTFGEKPDDYTSPINPKPKEDDGWPF